ncbi:unnamed protein product [Spirodela intermedia]|uniref:Uncharacterized protein n=1 Tax=Spirodela intermedia TaxID=51605 RepID=A0A7I8KAW0_SPIIN|nr:unnamed protein product [Spirodela intermedia]
MSAKNGGRKDSFAVLPLDVSGDNWSFLNRSMSNRTIGEGEEDGNTVVKRRKSKSSKRKKKKIMDTAEITAAWSLTSGIDDDENLDRKNGQFLGVSESSDVLERPMVVDAIERSEVEQDASESSRLTSTSFAELRQRSVNGGSVCNEIIDAEVSTRESSIGQWRPASHEHIPILSNQESTDWKRLMAEYPGLLEEITCVKGSPLSYFWDEINGGNSLRSTISVGNERKRQRVYNTMFHVPLRCERLIDVGFFVCLDTFLSLLTIMPARILMIMRRILNTRQFQMPNDKELSDVCCFTVLVFGVTALQLTDISLIYHIIRGQGTVKLYVVYNVLEILDNLLRSFGEDVLQVLFNSIEGAATCSPDSLTFELMRYILDQVIAIIAITLSTCVIAHNNALLALLISNNFAEIKSNVFKRVSKDNIHSLVCHDIIERFHITAFVLFILTQNILESEGSWFGGFLSNVTLVYMCEVLIDTIKHSFLAKFNEIKPATYSEFLEDLCKQILNIQTEDARKTLIFIPLAPACVVIRVLTPLYATVIPHRPLPLRLLWMVIWFSLTYAILVVCKMAVGLALSHLAGWYLRRHSDRKPHAD